MPYSKRWELYHILGGGCVGCGNQNFGEIQIDHVYNDGHIDRDFYTNNEARYADRPQRAKERLQLLCKKCHIYKHSGRTLTPAQERRKKMLLFMDILAFHETVQKIPVSESVLVSALKATSTFKFDEPISYIRLMLRQASIYESQPGYYNRV
jgi:hypothetical protein